MKVPPFALLLVSSSFLLAFAGGTNAQPFAVTTAAGSPGLEATVAENADGTNHHALFFSPYALTLDSTGNLYITDGDAIRKMAPLGTNWVVTTLAGQGVYHGASDGTNSAALFNYPQGITADHATNLYVADTYNNTIRRLTPSGTNWVSSTLAGLAGSSGSSNGINGAARFYKPYGLTMDLAGNLYVADTYNNTIRQVSPVGTNWVVTTIAGVALLPGSADGTNSSATFNAPAGLAMDTNDNLYVADFANNTIRKMTPSGTNWVVSTLAGLAGFAGSSDGTNSSARFSQPYGVAVDSANNVYVSDSANNTIRRLKPVGTNWVVTTLAGLGGASGAADGVGSAARFFQPYGLAVDATGALYVADDANYTIRQGLLAAWLQISRLGSKVIVSWPAAFTNYLCETNTSLSGGAWNPNTNALVISGDYVVQTNNLGTRNAFFRLHKP